ncbi:cystathionine beta-synthase [Pseudoscardovia radai]|uniref:Cystathionine beta-synthase n=1 Tax=Pseudoscardovia radai TaxID=987066 RepID=A0A261ESD8_9BIFI|nr:pyridoxal-phosphate dependent enzyme [Pseudoscardovia radai]OZG49758.1 cystathionine beta-synthase [Pseudoscardovia radai]
MKIAQKVTDLIGNTPLVELHKVTEGIDARIVVKVEYFNPGGSSKDRIAERIIDAAEREGKLQPGGTIVEPTSGNTGVGLALVAQQRGYHAVFVVPEKVNEDKRAVLRSYGATVVVTPNVEPDDPRSYYNVSDRLAELIPGGFKPNQYFNSNGPESHYRTTGPEIWRDTDGKVTHFVAGMGTCGTMMGTSKYLKEVSNGAVRAIGADPDGSIFSNPQDVHGYKVEGVGEDFYPGIYDPSLVDGFYHVSDLEAFAMSRRLSREEGLLVGGSSGMAVAGALKMAKAEKLTKDDLVVVLLPDSGRSYMSTIFNDQWLEANGFGKILNDEKAALGDDDSQRTIDNTIAQVLADANARAAAK